jgi:predicted metal-dependent peptidase
MARRSKRSGKGNFVDPATHAVNEAHRAILEHPLFAPLAGRTWLHRAEPSRCPALGWAVVTSEGTICVHPTRRGTQEEWCYVLAHCLLHLGFEHFRSQDDSRAWNAACDCVIARFLADLKFGRPPEECRGSLDLPVRDEAALFRHFRENGIAPQFACWGTASSNHADMLMLPAQAEPSWRTAKTPWAECLSAGISEAVSQAVEVASGERAHLGGAVDLKSNAQRARAWFVSSYPLLGALAATFKLIEDAQVCNRMGISIAAICADTQEIYINPSAALSPEEARFVLAHEMLHVGLRHEVRCSWRDPLLWNIACDYVINGWLIEMEIGALPGFGLLHDPEVKGLSAEAVYDRLATDMRRIRKLATLAGYGKCDILPGNTPSWWTRGDGVRLDELYRSCLGSGLVYHQQNMRGLLPASLVEEIRALDQPPIAWDVALAQWLDGYFAPLERRRTYARPSRRQSSTPDIPRARWYVPQEQIRARTFGVVIDTSGSMDRIDLGKALGAVRSYALSRDVSAVRVVFCDAAAYDQGYMPPDALFDRVRVRGRGGTVLQPGVDLLRQADDFPKAGPMLIITDGYCDRLRIAREHAFLLPKGRSLPFAPQGPVFRMDS